MPALPWMSLNDPGPTTVVMASRFRLRRFRDVPRFFLDSMRIHRQVRGADGALGISLVARPVRREFLTLSAWRDRAALMALVRTQPHASAMVRHRPAMAESTFTFWEVPADGLPVSWDEARRRLDARSPEATT
jgi:quinol monooxygenase YgiN